MLEGCNQFYCNICESKQNVIRTISLRKCPPYLHLQLLRFVYDRQKGCRKKLNSSINFPLVLDMKKYFQNVGTTECTVYHLCAVLVHRGKSAHSGHYIARIKDRASGAWYEFNDEFVEKTKGNVIKLCYNGHKNINGLDSVSNISKPLGDKNMPSSQTLTTIPEKQSAKFTKNSSDPYMLVYKIATLDDKSKHFFSHYFESIFCLTC